MTEYRGGGKTLEGKECLGCNAAGTIYIASQGKHCYNNSGFESCTRWEFGIQLYRR
ncbi:MAG: hypothetical protein ABSC53_08660 [Bacteroidota bacterium]